MAAKFEGGGGCFGWPFWDELKPFNLKPNQTLRWGFFFFFGFLSQAHPSLRFQKFPPALFSFLFLFLPLCSSSLLLMSL
jgi:hypothetical protein